MLKKLSTSVFFTLLLYSVSAQKGFIYLHLRNVNEETTPTTGMSFTISGTATPPITSFTLNDQPTVANYMYDIGASHGTATTGGDGELWVVTKSGAGATGDGTIYRRKPNCSTWDSPGLTGTAVDGAGVNQCVFANNSGYAYFYNAGTTTTIWSPSSHLGVKVVDVAYGDGAILVVASDGNIYRNTSSSSSWGDSWFLGILSLTARRLDVLPSNGNIVYTDAFGNVYTYTSGNLLVASLGNPGGTGSANYDVAYSDDGTVFAINSAKNVYYYNGSGWTNDASGQYLQCITGGPVKQCWATALWNYSYTPQTIYTRTCYGVSYSTSTSVSTSIPAVWVDDERCRTTYNDNSIVIPVDAGTYTITETVPSGWCMHDVDIYDPSSNSTAVTASLTLTINITAGEVVHAVVRNELIEALSMVRQCNLLQIVENFDTVTTAMPVTCYHWSTNTCTDAGYYSVGSLSTGWLNPTIKDHTSGTGKFMMINCAYPQDEFYRRRMTNLVAGCQYQVSFWAINLGGTISPNISFGINDSTGAVLQTSVTGAVANDLTWHNYTVTFTATTGTADVFLQNNATGGNGNCLGLDDICLSPISTAIKAVSVSPSPSSSNLCVGSSYSYSVSPAGGIWSCNNSAVVAVNATTGLVTTSAVGLALLTYTYVNTLGCTSDTVIEVTVSTPPTVVANIEYAGTSYKGANVCKSSSDSLKCTPSGGSWPYTCRWAASPSNSAAGLSVLNTQNILCNPTIAGTYIDTVTVTDAVGCTATDTTIEVVEAATQPAIALSGSGLNCTTSTDTLSASLTTAGTAPYKYSWSCPQTGNGLININAALTTAIPTVSGSFSYTLTLTDAANCIAQAVQTVSINASPSLSVSAGASSVTLCTNGAIGLTSTPSGGTLPYKSYSWSCSHGGNLVSSILQNTTATLLSSGVVNFSLTVTDSKGCTATASTGNINVTLNASLIGPVVTVSATPLSLCASTSTSAITLSNTLLVGGKFPYTYSWSGPSGCNIASPTSANTSSSLAASGNFLLAVTDANGCTSVGTTASITVNALPVVTASSTLAALCKSDLSTTLSALASGGSGSGYNGWSWTCSPSNGGISSPSSQTTTASPGTTSPTTAYTYSVTVKDGNGCTSLAASVQVTSSGNLNPSVTISPAAGASICGTTINLSNTTSGGLAPYTYLWSGTGIAANTSSSTTATPGTTGLLTYGLVVKDANLCQTSVSAAVEVYAALTAKAAVSVAAICGTDIGISLYANVSGGAGVYAYAWSSVSPGNGLGVTTLPVTTCTPTAAAGASLLYDVNVTDILSGCTVTAATSAVLVVSPPSVSVSATLTTPCLNQPIALSASTSGGSGTGPYTCVWSCPIGATIASYTSLSTTAIPLSVGAYVFAALVLDANNCSVSANTAAAVVYSLPSATLNVGTVSVCANPATLINLTATPSGGCGKYTSCQWTGSGCTHPTTTTCNNTATPTVSGTFGVSITDSNGCVSPVAVSANVAVDVALPQISVSCGTNTNGISYLNLYEATGVNWDWTDNSGGRFYTSSALSLNSDSSTSHLQAPYVVYQGAYAVQITDPQGCIGSGSVNAATSAGLGGSCSGIILAISLPYFTAEAQAGDVLLNWATATETNNEYFGVERSSDAKNWTAIGTVEGHGNSTVTNTYNFADPLPLNGVNYYRLKQVNFDGTYSFTDVRQVDFAGNKAVRIFPNPARDYLTIEFNSDKNQQGNVVIESALGAVVYAGLLNITTGLNNITLNCVQQLAQGAYVIKVITPDNMIKSKFVKAGN